MAAEQLHLGVALEGAGWHPAAWREPAAQPQRLFSPEYWAELATEAEAGGVDFVTIEDSLRLQSAQPLLPDARTDEVRGRLDALLIASYLAPRTHSLGLIPVVTTTLTEPFHISKAVATLDHTSAGRAGFQARLSLSAEEFSHLGRRDVLAVSSVEQLLETSVVEQAFAEACDVVEVIRRLWDSWEDDAEIRDVATDRFLDPQKLHTIDFVGESFSIRGPSITPRPPQGQPVVAALAHHQIPYRFAARSADIVFTTPALDTPQRVLEQVREAESAVQRGGPALKVSADLVVFFDENGGETGRQRLERLDALGRALDSDAAVVAGSAEQVAEVITALAQAGYDGVRLRPGVLGDDLPRITEQLVPLLQHQGLLPRTRSASPALRTRLSLPEAPANRYTGQRGKISPAPASAL